MSDAGPSKVLRKAVADAVAELVDSETGGHALSDVVEVYLGRGLTDDEIRDVDQMTVEIRKLIKKWGRS